MLAFLKTCGLLILLYYIQFSSALYFYISETETKCFIEEIPFETMVVVNCNVEVYDPRNGEFMPSTYARSVHVEVRDPQHSVILSRPYTRGRIFFTSSQQGQHVICLSSNDSMLRVHLDIKVGSATINYATVALKERLSPIERRVRQLLDLVEQIHKEQDFQIEREYQFRRLSKSVQQWVLIWCIIQACLLLVLVCIWNFRHLKNIFKTLKLNCVETVVEDRSRLSQHEDLAIVSFLHSCSTKKEHYTKCTSCAEKYCNQKSCEEVWKQYHGIHCMQTCIAIPGQPINHLYEAWKQVQFPPETISIVLTASIIPFVCQSEDSSRAVSVSLQGLTLEGLHMLCRLVANKRHDKLFNEWIKKLSELQKPAYKKQELDSIIKKLSKATNTEKNNSHISENSAVVPLLNISEDNCELNGTVTTSPNSIFLLSMCSVRDIHTNEEIIIIHPDRNALERSQHGRQTLLRGKYLFTCYCSKCVKPEEDHAIRNDAHKSSHYGDD